MKIVIYTDMFPYGKFAEPFLAKELIYISKVFDEVIIFPLNGSDIIRDVPINVKVLDPIFKSKKEILSKGIMNLFFNIDFITEFFDNKVYRRYEKLKSYLLATLTIRAIFTDTSFKKIILDMDKKTINYFYWARGFSYALPLVRELSNSVVRFHGYDLYEERYENYIPYRRQQLKNIDSCIFISQQGKKYLIDKYKLLVKNPFVYYLGTENYGLQKFISKKFRIVSCSNLIPIKRVELIINALKSITDIHIEYLCIGDGPDKKALEILATKLPSNIDISFTGSLSNEEVIGIYRNNYIDIFVNVSESEGLPVSIMEVLSFGIPVIATDVGGTSEIVNCTNGFLLQKNFLLNNLSEIISRYFYLDNILKNKYRYNAHLHWEKNFSAEKNYTNFSKYLYKITN